MMARKRFSLRSLLLPFAAATTLLAPALASGCGGGVDSISKIDGLRVLAVAVSRAPTAADPTTGGSYARPDDRVTFQMTSYDGFVDPAAPDAPPRQLQTVWLGGCFDPPGDAYYGCYESLAGVLGDVQKDQAAGMLPGPDSLYGVGDSFSMTLPSDLVTRRPRPPGSSYYGIAYVFFAVCAGYLGPVKADSSGGAGAFPLGCFQDEARTIRLGAESFVPGYTQIYSFEDGRTNADPAVQALTFDAKDPGVGPGNALIVKPCAVDDDTRIAPASCSKADPFATCTAIKIDITAAADVAEDDPEGTASDGKKLKEVVWVDYFADKGDLDNEVALVNDATTGLIADHSVQWIAPPEPGVVTIWAVVHDARGGVTTLQRYINVQ
jgi:hypothetical protein